MNARDIIKKKPYLVWHTANYDNLSDDVVVEAVLNYGELSDVAELISVMGRERVKEIFERNSSKERSNYRKDIKNYFNIYFSKDE